MMMSVADNLLAFTLAATLLTLTPEKTDTSCSARATVRGAFAYLSQSESLRDGVHNSVALGET